MTTKKFDEAASKKQAAELAENLVEHKAKRFVCSVDAFAGVAGFGRAGADGDGRDSV